MNLRQVKIIKLILISSFFLVSILFGFWLLNKNKSPVYIYYNADEIYPIVIDNYGFPNVRIEYLEKPVWVVWDTGNMVGLMLSNYHIHENGFKKIDSIHMRDSEGLSLGYSYQFRIDSIKIFDRIRYGMIASVSPADHNGLFGPRFIDHKHFTIDYKRKLMGISNKKLLSRRMTGIELPMIKSDHFPRLIVVEVLVNGHKVLAEIDTGKSRTVVDPTLVSDLALVESTKGLMIDNLKIGSLSFEINNGKTKSFKGINRDFNRDIKIGIGSDILKSFVLTVDYDRGVVILNKN